MLEIILPYSRDCPLTISDVSMLRELLSYEPDTGLFKWRARELKYFATQRACKVWNTRYADKEAGTVARPDKPLKYTHIIIGYQDYYAHRLAWWYANGPPVKKGLCIDHIDGNGRNNAIDNLREVTHAENLRNSSIQSNNTSGIVGVCRTRNGKRWRANIVIKGRQMHLGVFDNFQDAVECRKAALIKYDFHVNHGKVKPLW